MPSQLEMLKENLSRAQETLGPDAHFVKALQLQIRCLENRLIDGPQPNPITMGKR